MPLNLRIVLSDPFSDVSYLCITYVYNDCHRTNHNHRSKMGMTSHLSDAYNPFFFFVRFFFLALESDDDESDESDDDGSGSGFTSGSCVLLCFEISVDRVS